jgi:hypothetical protein
MDALSAGASLQRSATLLRSSLSEPASSRLFASGDAATVSAQSPLDAAAAAADETAAVIDQLEAALDEAKGDEKAGTAPSPATWTPSRDALLAQAAAPAPADGTDGDAALASLAVTARQTTITATEDGASATSRAATLEVGPDGLYLAAASLTVETATTDRGTVASATYSSSRVYVGSLEGFSRYADAFA